MTPPIREGITAVTIIARDLSTYMTLADMALVFMFDFTRVPSGFFGWGDHDRIDRRAPDLFYHGGGIGNASYVNGRMIVRSAIPLQRLIDDWKEESSPTRQEYATFKILIGALGKRLVGVEDDRHILTVAGSRSGKIGRPDRQPAFLPGQHPCNRSERRARRDHRKTQGRHGTAHSCAGPVRHRDPVRLRMAGLLQPDGCPHSGQPDLPRRRRPDR